MRRYTVAHAGRESDAPFSAYLYDVFRDGEKVAQLGHDYRGEDHWINLPEGKWIALPQQVILGGGPEPLTLSLVGVEAIERLID